MQLPKIYTLTLLLSLTLPQGHRTGHSASHVFSLPTIELDPTPTPRRSLPSSLTHRRSSPSSRITVLPPLQLGNKEKHGDGDKRKSSKSGLSSVVARSWRLSQEWVSWSLLAGEDRRESGKSKDEEGKYAGAKWNRQEYEMPVSHSHLDHTGTQQRQS